MKKLLILLFGDQTRYGLIPGTIKDFKIRWKIFWALWITK